VKKRFGIFAAVVIAAALTLTGCSSSDSATSESASCAKADLATVTEGKLTIATGEPAYYPWIIDDAPQTGNGFEGAVAYAVAKQLGFTNDEVVWVRTTFDSAVTPSLLTTHGSLMMHHRPEMVSKAQSHTQLLSNSDSQMMRLYGFVQHLIQL